MNEKSVETIEQLQPDKNIKNLNSADDVFGWIKNAINGLINLDIKTEIISGQKEFIHTVINLAEGDITTQIHQKFVEDKFDVAEFHQKQVLKAEEIISRNIETVKSIGEWLIERIS